MRIGLITQTHGRPGGDRPVPTWASIKERAVLAEQVGFDMFVYEDALMYKGDSGTMGVWESVALSGAIAEATSPAACPPMPSATTKTPCSKSISNESSLLSRTGPGSVRA